MRRWVGWVASLALAAGLVTAGATSASESVALLIDHRGCHAAFGRMLG